MNPLLFPLLFVAAIVFGVACLRLLDLLAPAGRSESVLLQWLALFVVWLLVASAASWALGVIRL